MKILLAALIILASSAAHGGAIELKWSSVADPNTAGYIVTRSTDLTTYALVLDAVTTPTVRVKAQEPGDAIRKDSKGRVVGMTDKNLQASTWYFYNVYAYDRRGRLSEPARVGTSTLPLRTVANLQAEGKP